MLNALFDQSRVPPEHRWAFQHLYWEVGWFGVLSGSSLSFLYIYATRIGATALQIGLMTALTALTNLALAIPAANWLQRRPLHASVFWTSVAYRAGFLLLIPLPWLLSGPAQVWALVILTLSMAVPLTPLGIGFNALLAEAVPAEWRAHVAGIRGATLAITFMLSAYASGLILRAAPFPLGYQIVFAIGAAGAAMSSFHIYRIRTPAAPTGAAAARSGVAAAWPLRFDVWRTHFRRVLLALFAFHLAQYLAMPLFPLYSVRVLGLQDNQIGLGTALFYLTVLVGSTQLRRASHRLGHRQVTGVGVIGMGFYPLLLAFATRPSHFYWISLLGGFAFALASGAFANYMLEHIPADDRPSHLAWYNVVFNAAILAGALIGPLIADRIGLAGALVAFGVLRFFAGLVIIRAG